MAQHFSVIQARETGLSKTLTAGQMGMIALGGAIGTGLFLGSKFAIGFAGPSVILSYAIGGAIALMLMGVLAEMTVKHMFTWFMIFVTHIAFRRRMKATGETLAYKLPGSTVGAVLGAILLLAVLISTAFTEEFRATIPFGIPCLIIVTVAFFAVKRNKAKVNTKA